MNVREEKSRHKVSLGQDGNALVNLIVFNAVLFVLLKFVYVIYQVSDLSLDAYYKNIFYWFTVPSDLTKLSMRPWTLITFMFTDDSVLRLIANVFWLWAFGYIMQDLTGNRKLVPLYIYGGLAGALFYALSYNLFPHAQDHLPSSVLMGANASIMAIAVATTTVSPDYRIFPLVNGGIPLWILMLVFAVLDVASIHIGDVPQYMSHLGGAAMGFFFIYQLRKGRDWSEWMNGFFDWLDALFDPNKKGMKPAKDQFFYKVHTSPPYKKTPNVTQKRIDEILDKINQKGIHFLTDEERDILKRAASKDDL
ncbi:MAG: rhomboid family intramembrane serine protease [Williamsia sp.]|nr:rhomboid family intramembrane serine protease [Williamsia sp.]